MNLTKLLVVASLQLLMVAALAVVEADELHFWGWVILGAIFFQAWFLLLMGLRSRTRIAYMADELRRAVQGNLRTRLLTKEDPLWNEVVYAMNELLEKLEQVQVRSVQSEAARKSLLASISHDIRTPLTSIIGYVDAIRDGIPATEQEQQEYLKIVSVKAAGLKKMMDEIFTMAKLDANELPEKRERLDLAEALREMIIEFLPEFGRRGLELQASIPEQPCLVMADRVGLHRIIGNILHNAVVYGSAGKVVGVELLERDEEYRVTIWDCGPGIPPTELGRVFERGFRGDLSRSTQPGSSGLRLSIAKALAERQGGRIWVNSEPGVRTVVTIALPRGLP